MPFLGEEIWRKTSDDVDNFVDKGVENKWITVENVWKRGIKALPQKEKASGVDEMIRIENKIESEK